MKVLCFGSLNIDYVYSVDHFVTKGETLSSTRLEVFTGGKGLNQSIALARAGAQVFHAGAIGPDGQFLLEAMGRAGVDTGHVAVLTDQRTGNAIIQRDREGDNCILLYGGANQRITPAQIDAVLAGFGQGDYLVVQNEINQLPYLLRQAHARGMVIVLNPSPMNEKIMALPLEAVDIFMLNEVEAAQLLGSGAEDGSFELAGGLRRRFPQAVIVLTVGGDGAIYTDSSTQFAQCAFRVDVRDTTAAGDTFTGFFLGGLISGQSPRQAMRQAAAAAAIACSRPGAAPSIPTAEEVTEFLRIAGKETP